jgi:HTH-type transcriptional regulator, glycine betaine synthesis regulator
MSDNLLRTREHFLQGVSRISAFWGFPKAMGAIYGALYLSPQALSLDDLVEQVRVTKGAVSTNVRALERLGMVHQRIQVGERKDYYFAETDFWKIVKGILREREKSEFDQALRMVDESLEMVEGVEIDPQEAELVRFYQKRLAAMQSFFRSLDSLVATLLALDEFRLGALEKLLGVRKNGNP